MEFEQSPYEFLKALGPVVLSAEEVVRVKEGIKAAEAGDGVSRKEFREEMERLLNPEID